MRNPDRARRTEERQPFTREVHARAGSTAVNPLFIIDVRFSYHPDIFRSTDNLICGKINIKT